MSQDRCLHCLLFEAIQDEATRRGGVLKIGDIAQGIAATWAEILTQIPEP